MPKRWIVLVGMCLAMVTGVASAERAVSFFSGNKLYARMQSTPFRTTAGRDLGVLMYIEGISDELNFLFAAEDHVKYCIPPYVRGSQLYDIVKRYLRDHPATRQYAAASLTTIAIEKAFPCR